MKISQIWIIFTVLLANACSTLPKEQFKQLQVEKRWTRSTLRNEHLEFRHLHRFKPILTQEMVIQGNGIDGISAYDRQTGALRWRFTVKEGVEGSAQLINDTLFFGASDGNFYAIDALKGTTRWSFPVRAEVLGEPIVFAGKVFFLAGNNVAYALNVEDGRQAWLYSRRDASSLSIRGAARPLVTEDLIVFGFSEGSLVALRRETGSVAWEQNINRNKRFKDADTNPILVDSTIYVSSYDGGLYTINAKDGKVIWSIDEGGYSELAIDDNRIYASTSGSEIISIERSSGKVLWRHKNKMGVSGQPLVYKGLVIVGEFGGVLKFLDKETGVQVHLFDPGRGVTSSPVLDADKQELYFMSADANLFALRVTWKSGRDKWPWE